MTAEYDQWSRQLLVVLIGGHVRWESGDSMESTSSSPECGLAPYYITSAETVDTRVPGYLHVVLCTTHREKGQFWREKEQDKHLRAAPRRIL